MATMLRERHEARITLAAAASPGDIDQMPDGRAGVLCGLDAAAAADRVNYATEGRFKVTKTTGQYWIDGAPVWWDRSAGAATCVPPLTTGDRDFFLGTVDGDVAAATAEGIVNLNVRPVYEIDLDRDLGDTVPVLTAGTPYAYSRGGGIEFGFSATAEAQKLDWLSQRSFALSANWVLEAVFNVKTNADADVADFSLGVANASHASDADSITESAFIHLDMGADLNIDAESDDGTNEVAATDTTVDFAVGTPVHVVIDGRDPSALAFYVNGARVLSGTTFNISAAAGPLKALAHLEKSANDSPGAVQIGSLRVRTQE